MASSVNRITGLASGLDIDSIVQETMKAYKTKVTKKKQEKTLLEMKQQLYRDLIKEGRDFYDKYFDITKSDSLLNSKNYATIKFSSSNSYVATATSSPDALNDTYKINVATLATAAKAEIDPSLLNEDMKITINDKNTVFISKEELSKCATNKEKAKLINSKISSYNMKAVASDFNEGKIVIESTIEGSSSKFSISTGTIVPETVTGSESEKRSFSLNDLTGENAKDLMFSVGEKNVIIKASDIKAAVKDAKDDEEKLKAVSDFMKSKLSSLNISAEVDNNNIKINSSDGNTTFKLIEGTYEAQHLDTNGEKVLDENNTNGLYQYTNGTDLKATISSSVGELKYGDGSGEIKSGNNITLDGVTFKLTGTGDTIITGEVDTSGLVSKIKSFVEDYNKLVTTLTKYTTENKARDYAVLTDDQKKEMTDKEIEKWNEKVMQGQFKDDYDIASILNKLTSCVDTAFGTLSYSEKESIGISRSQDWSSTSKNNLIIDESKLSEAIAKDPEKIINLFNDPKTGIMTQMKNVLNDEFMFSSKSALIKKAGYEGTSYFAQNTLTKQISEYNTKISDMESDLSDKEQALYSKWSTIETTMQKLNAQLSNLQSYFSN